ncbi:MAG TPA: hypothetical protein VN370_06215 [Desulfitobacteriaceae bacterium]|nr:hypothetical protein [Desulfitobacteriaceae bacterium]
MMKLYALKCPDGYLKVSGNSCCCVELEQASVFPREKLSCFPDYINIVGKSGFVKIRVVELIVKENEDFIYNQAD